MRRNILIMYIILLAIAVLALAYFAASLDRDQDNQDTASPSFVPSTTQTTPAPSTTLPQTSSTENIVTYSASGFTPASIIVSPGTAVQFLNQSTQDMWPVSNPHPEHSDYSEFDAKAAIKPDESFTFTFTKPGTWTYHNELNQGQTGTVTVQ